MKNIYLDKQYLLGFSQGAILSMFLALIMGNKIRGIAAFFVSTSIEADDNWIYDIDMLSFETACNVIFPMSDRIEVIEPCELRKYIMRKTKKILKLYGAT